MNNNKQLKYLILMIGVVVVLLAAVLIVVFTKPAADSEEVPTGSNIFMNEIDSTINSIQYTREGEEFSFSKGTDAGWHNDLDPEFPLNQKFLSDLTGVLVKMTATNSFERGNNSLSDYGLDQPYGTLFAADESGHSFNLSIGKAATTGDYYALLNEDTATVYTITSDIPSAMSMSLLSLADIDIVPSLAVANIDSISISFADTAMTMQKETTTNAEGNIEYLWSLEEDGAFVPIEEATAAIEADGMTAESFAANLVTAIGALKADACLSTDPEFLTALSDKLAGTITVDYTDAEQPCTMLMDVFYNPTDGSYAIHVDGKNVIASVPNSSMEDLLSAHVGLAR